jgi:hypothetical protein
MKAQAPPCGVVAYGLARGLGASQLLVEASPCSSLGRASTPVSRPNNFSRSVGSSGTPPKLATNRSLSSGPRQCVSRTGPGA